MPSPASRTIYVQLKRYMWTNAMLPLCHECKGTHVTTQDGPGDYIFFHCHTCGYSYEADVVGGELHEYIFYSPQGTNDASLACDRM